MSSVAVTYSAPVGVQTVTLDLHSRLRFIVSTDYVGAPAPLLGLAPVYGSMLAPGVGAENVGLPGLANTFNNEDVSTVYEYVTDVPGAENEVIPDNQVTAIAVSAGTITVTRTGGSDAFAQANTLLWVENAVGGPDSWADCFLSMPEASAISFTP